jgi:hypothetical protein
MFARSESIAQLSAALSKAQGLILGAKKDAANPFFKSKYADLASVWEAIRGPLSANGLSIMQFPRSTDAGVEVETVLSHESGEWVSESLALPVAKADAQGIGSAITYARRYGLQAVAGVAPEDDDGNAAAASATSMRDVALKTLKIAAKAGLPALEAAWKKLPAPSREACKLDLPGLKEEASHVALSNENGGE